MWDLTSAPLSAKLLQRTFPFGLFVQETNTSAIEALDTQWPHLEMSMRSHAQPVSDVTKAGGWWLGWWAVWAGLEWCLLGC